MDDVMKELERDLRFVHGRPEVVEERIHVLKDTYVVTGFYYYVVGDHLEVCAELVNQREIRKAQLAQGLDPRRVVKQ